MGLTIHLLSFFIIFFFQSIQGDIVPCGVMCGSGFCQKGFKCTNLSPCHGRCDKPSLQVISSSNADPVSYCDTNQLCNGGYCPVNYTCIEMFGGFNSCEPRP